MACDRDPRPSWRHREPSRQRDGPLPRAVSGGREREEPPLGPAGGDERDQDHEQEDGSDESELYEGLSGFSVHRVHPCSAPWPIFWLPGRVANGTSRGRQNGPKRLGLSAGRPGRR